MQKKTWILFGALILLQWWVISNLTLFIAPEFSLYPYFTGRGLLPYQDIIDQHFPLIFFGPVHLGQLGLANPEKLRTLLFGLVTIIHLDFWWLTEKKGFSLNKRAWLQLGLVIALGLLGVNHLWLETFALGLVLTGLVLLELKLDLAQIGSGLLWGATVIIRPLLAPLLLLLWWIQKRSINVVLGVVLAGAGVAWWLWQQGLWPDFFQLLRFNGAYYASMAARLPHRGELIQLIWVLGWLGVSLKFERWQLLAVAAALLPSYPRFELYHNMLLLSLPTWPGIKTRLNLASKLWLALGLVLLLRQTSRQPNANFFYPDSLYQQASVINSFHPIEMYLFGGPDQLYFLTNTLPPGGFYLPSLPWYHANQDWVDRQIAALENHPQALVVINRESRVGDQDLLNYSRRLGQYIHTYYQLEESVGPLDIYRRSSGLAFAYENRY